MNSDDDETIREAQHQARMLRSGFGISAEAKHAIRKREMAESLM